MKIEIIDEWTKTVKAQEEGEESVRLYFNGEYRNRDHIIFSGLEKGTYYVINVDSALGEAFVFVDTDIIRYDIPYYESRESYNPIAFSGNRHFVTIRKAFDFEITNRRNLALNPFDQAYFTDVYPHASSNVDEEVITMFKSQNAIDGIVATKNHGEWPYESWSVNRRDDAYLKIDFGRSVDICEIRLYTRADFPHDNYWVSGTFEFSDGSKEKITMEKHIDEPHIFKISKKKVSYLMLKELKKSDEQSPFPALSQIEVYGQNS